MNLIYNALKTPDGTIIESRHRHDYVQHLDKNGNIYFIDGGLDYTRSSMWGDEEFLCLYDIEPHETQRVLIKWGTRGKSGRKKLKYISIAEMETDHIQAVLYTQPVSLVYKNCMLNELELRNVDISEFLI